MVADKVAVGMYMILTGVLVLFTLNGVLQEAPTQNRQEMVTGNKYRISSGNFTMETVGVDSSRLGTRADSANFFLRNSFFFRQVIARVEVVIEELLNRFEMVSGNMYRAVSANFVAETAGVDSSRSPTFSQSPNFGFRNSFFFRVVVGEVEAAILELSNRFEMVTGNFYRSNSANFIGETIGVDSSRSPTFSQSANFGFRNSFFIRQVVGVIEEAVVTFRFRIQELTGGTAYRLESANFAAQQASVDENKSAPFLSSTNFGLRPSSYTP